MVYLTDTIGLASGIVGTLIAASKLFDGFTDVFFGSLIDKTHTKLGKARPWMLYAYIGCAVTLVANFAIPDTLGTTAQYAWFFVAYTLLNAVFFTANNIAYASLVTFCTKNSRERVEMGSWRFIFAFSTSLLIQSVTVQFVRVAGGGAAAWRTVAVVYAVIGLIVNTISVFSIKELPEEELKAGKGTRQALSEGYANAFSAIFDSNLTSIITGIILFNFGTGPIRGFATTLIIGILCSFFSAVFLTRLVYEHFMNKDKWMNLTFTTGISKNLMQKNVHYNFIAKTKRFFTVWGTIIIICIVSFFVRGLAQSIDFTGGRNFVVQFEQKVAPETVRELLQPKVGDANVQAIALGTDGRTVRVTTNYRIEEDSPTIDAEIEEFLYQALKDGNLLGEGTTLEIFIDRDNRVGGSIISSQKVGPSIADDIKTSAIWSVVLALIAIGLYILIRFSNIAFSIGATVALTVDTLLIIGAYSLCHGWMPFSLEIDQTFIGAILTAIGYSINDKVVIFDRVREFLGLYPKRDRVQLFNDSLNTTLSRTINTSLSTLIVLLSIFILGGDSIRSFAFAMILGVVIGTLSSLFIAAPVAYLTMGNKMPKGEEAKA